MEKTRLVLLTLLTVLILSGFGLHAQERENSSSTTSTQTIPQEESSPYSLLFNATYNTDRYRWGDVRKAHNMDFTLNPLITFSDSVSLSLVLAANKDFEGERAWAWQDTYIAPTFTLFKFAQDSKLSLITRVYFPTSKTSQKDSQLKSKFYLGPQVTFGQQTLNLPLVIKYRPYGTVAFHEYEVSKSGQSNSKYSLAQRLILQWVISEKLSLYLDNIYSRSWSYRGNSKDTYILDQALSYDLNQSLSLSLGHNNTDSALRVSGQDVNIDLHKDNTSTFYLALDLSI